MFSKYQIKEEAIDFKVGKVEELRLGGYVSDLYHFGAPFNRILCCSTYSNYEGIKGNFIVSIIDSIKFTSIKNRGFDSHSGCLRKFGDDRFVCGIGLGLHVFKMLVDKPYFEVEKDLGCVMNEGMCDENDSKLISEMIFLNNDHLLVTKGMGEQFLRNIQVSEDAIKYRIKVGKLSDYSKPILSKKHNNMLFLNIDDDDRAVLKVNCNERKIEQKFVQGDVDKSYVNTISTFIERNEHQEILVALGDFDFFYFFNTEDDTKHMKLSFCPNQFHMYSMSVISTNEHTLLLSGDMEGSLTIMNIENILDPKIDPKPTWIRTKHHKQSIDDIVCFSTSSGYLGIVSGSSEKKLKYMELPFRYEPKVKLRQSLLDLTERIEYFILNLENILHEDVDQGSIEVKLIGRDFGRISKLLFV